MAGGTGFLGSHICRGARERGHRVWSISTHHPPPTREIEGVTYLFTDLAREVPSLPGDLDLVINAAGYVAHPVKGIDSQQLVDHHVSIARHLCEANQEARCRLIHLGSGDEYEDSGFSITENSPCGGRGAYGRAKAAATKLITTYAPRANFDFTVLRLFLVYGPLQAENRLIPQLVKTLLRGERVPMSRGDQVRDFLYVDDVVDAVFHSAQNESTRNRCLNVASGRPVVVSDLARLVQQLIGSGELGLGDLSDSREQSEVLVGNPELLARLTGWAPTFSLEDGLSRTIDWYRQISS